MSTRKIAISQLRKGMFIHELDIPWIQSPFLRHRRKISTENDIALLHKAGARELSIDLARSDDVSSENNDKTKKVSERPSSDSLKTTGGHANGCPGS